MMRNTCIGLYTEPLSQSPFRSTHQVSNRHSLGTTTFGFTIIDTGHAMTGFLRQALKTGSGPIPITVTFSIHQITHHIGNGNIFGNRVFADIPAPRTIRGCRGRSAYIVNCVQHPLPTSGSCPKPPLILAIRMVIFGICEQIAAIWGFSHTAFNLA